VLSLSVEKCTILPGIKCNLKVSGMIPESINAIINCEKGPLSREELVLGESMKALELAI